MSVERAYLHGTSPSEQGRLSLLNRLMNDAAMREIGVRPGDSIVDFGCGLAQLSLQMAQAAGSRLLSLLHEAGAAPVRSTWIYFGSCAAEANWPGFVENIHSQLAGAREAMVQGGLLGAAEIDAALDAFREWARRPEAAIWYAVCLAEGARR